MTSNIQNVKTNVVRNTLEKNQVGFREIVYIPHNKNGTFQLRFRGPAGYQIWCDQGNGTTQHLTLAGTGTNTFFQYDNDGTQLTVKVWGDLDNVTYFYGYNMSLTGTVDEFVKFRNANYIAAHQGNSLTGKVDSLTQLPLNNAIFTGNAFTYSGANFSKWDLTTAGQVVFRDCFSTQGEVDALLIAWNASGFSNKTIYLDGTCPAPSAASAAAIAALTGRGCTIFTN